MIIKKSKPDRGLAPIGTIFNYNSIYWAAAYTSGKA
jgi:hypothetical protein